MFKLDLERAEEQEIKSPMSIGSSKKQESSRKTSTSALLTTPKPLMRASLVAQMVKRLSAMQETGVQSLGWEDPLEKKMAAHSSIFAWRIPWTEQPDRGSQNPTRLSDFTFTFKAFDCVDHKKLWKILQEMGLPDHLTFLLRNLYAGQEAAVRTRCGKTDWFQIGKGIHQGC